MPAQRRPQRALYGHARTLRPYSRTDALCADALRRNCRERLGGAPEDLDAFRDRLQLTATSELVVSDGAIAVLLNGTDATFLLAPPHALLGLARDQPDQNRLLLLIHDDAADQSTKRVHIAFDDDAPHKRHTLRQALADSIERCSATRADVQRRRPTDPR